MQNKLKEIYIELGITDEHLKKFVMPAYVEPSLDQLSIFDLDYEGRPFVLQNAAGIAWKKMQSTANEAGVELIPYSGFRSIKLQRNLIKGQLRAGKNIDDILSRLAIPGYSEHHTGKAIDIISKDVIKLDESFESTDAFKWLQQNAEAFGFELSYPRNNPYGIIYEPWHWCFR